MGSVPPYPQEFRAYVVARVRAGETRRNVAIALGVSETAVSNWCARAGCPGDTGFSRKYTQEECDTARDMRRNGLSYRAIGRTLRISEAKIIEWTKAISEGDEPEAAPAECGDPNRLACDAHFADLIRAYPNGVRFARAAMCAAQGDGA